VTPLRAVETPPPSAADAAPAAEEQAADNRPELVSGSPTTDFARMQRDLALDMPDDGQENDVEFGDRDNAASTAPRADMARDDTEIDLDAVDLDAVDFDNTDFSTTSLDRAELADLDLDVARTELGVATVSAHALPDSELAELDLAEFDVDDIGPMPVADAEPAVLPSDAPQPDLVSVAQPVETTQSPSQMQGEVVSSSVVMAGEPAQPMRAASLGAAILQQGVIGNGERADPFSAVRKMSYAERIAFYS
jgi:hypothetical protein